MADPQAPIEPAEIVRCPLCQGIFPVLQVQGGSVVVVQPFPVEALAPFRGLLHSSKPIAPPVACKKALEGTMTVRKMPPVFVPHIFCCPGAGHVPPLFQPLPDPTEEGTHNGEETITEKNDSGSPREMGSDQPGRSPVDVPMYAPGAEDHGAEGRRREDHNPDDVKY